MLVGFRGYQLADDIRALTEVNAHALEEIFAPLGATEPLSIGSSAAGEEDLSATNALRIGTEAALEKVTDQTDIILDVSSLPRVVYLALMTSLLYRLVPDKHVANGSPLAASSINFQILVAEDAALDAQIRAEDPSNDLILIPGFSGALHAESVQEWPLVWFPILGEHRVNQLQKVMASAMIPNSAEICPVLPQPSRDPRRADRLLIEYKVPLFDSRQTPMSNILYVHEAHPFETYRQLLGAMRRYQNSMAVLGGCRLVVTPLASKLITLGAGLACFEMRPDDLNHRYGVAIPHAEPTRYIANVNALTNSKPELSALLLTGEAYA